MVMFPAKHITANSARRSPVNVGSPTELDTITPMPTMVRVMATATRRVMGSPRNNRAHSEAIRGAAATMATTLATRVSVMEVMKASWLTEASAPTHMSGNRWVRSDSNAGRRSNHRPKVECTTNAQHDTRKATSNGPASDTRTQSESVETDSIPRPASSHPSGRRSSVCSALTGSS